MSGRLQRIVQGVALVGVVGLLGLLVYSIVRNDSGKAFVDEIAAGRLPDAPAFALPLIERRRDTWPAALQARSAGRKAFGTADLTGTPYVLNFYASWCVPCRDEAKLLAASATSYAGRVVYLGVAFQDLTRDTSRFADRFGLNFGLVRDPGSKVSRKFGLTGVPETYFVDREGRVVAHKAGSVDAKELAAGVRAALAGKALTFDRDSGGLAFEPVSPSTIP
jgi:cytochrome c biogenesis protein CcmG/thiol:disulfide interchange protein DsbE